MADKLKDNKVTSLEDARKKKGAKPEPKSRSELRRAAAKTPGLGDNVGDEKALREALELQLLGLRSKHREIDLRMEAMREELREEGANRKVVRDAIQKIVPLELFDEAYEDGRTSRVDLAKKEELRRLVRSAFGLSDASARQPELPLAGKAPAYGSEHWEAEGYRIGITGTDPQTVKVPPEHEQPFLRGLANASARNAEGLKALDTTPPADAAAREEPFELTDEEIEGQAARPHREPLEPVEPEPA